MQLWSVSTVLLCGAVGDSFDFWTTATCVCDNGLTGVLGVFNTLLAKSRPAGVEHSCKAEFLCVLDALSALIVAVLPMLLPKIDSGLFVSTIDWCLYVLFDLFFFFLVARPLLVLLSIFPPN